MKYPHTCLALLAMSGVALGGVSPAFAQSVSREPIVITPPAKPDGSNASRAPFAAARPFDDVRPADGQPVDIGVPPNTPASNSEPALPPPAVAILGPRPDATATTTVVTVPADTTLTPTGRSTVAVATSLEATRVVPSLRAATHSSREQVIADVEARLTASEKPLASLRSSASEMSATGRTQFKSSDDAVKERERALRSSIRAARNASAAEWEAARSRLAADYEAYAAALASLDAAAGITTR